MRKENHKWRTKNADKARRMDQQWKDKNPDSARRRRLKYLYGITLDEYNARVESQNGCCKICRNPQDLLHVDHCHETNRVRGLLCNSCNHMLGAAKDDIGILMAGIDYLEEFRALQ